MNMNLQYFGGRGSAGGTNTGSSGSTEKSNTKGSVFSEMYEEEAETVIDSAKFTKVKGGNYWYFETKDSDFGEFTIERDTTGLYVITQKVNGKTVDQITVDGSINSAKQDAKEFMKSRWRTMYG